MGRYIDFWAYSLIRRCEFALKRFAVGVTPAQHTALLKAYLQLSAYPEIPGMLAALEMDGDTMTEARLALGGVAHTPWRDRDAEALLQGQRATRDHFQRAADALLRDAQGFGHNHVKIELATRAMGRALRRAAAGEEHP